MSPPVFVQTSQERATQIIALERLAAIVAMLTFRKYLKGHYIILFIDNLSGACAFAKGTSPMKDLQGLIIMAHKIAHILEIKWWIEFVPSNQNVVDYPLRETKQFADLEFPGCILLHSDYNNLLGVINASMGQKTEVGSVQ